MIIISGRYRWFQRHMGYRPDYCLACASSAIANQVRSFDFAHLYWVPILPLGFRRRWHCSECGNSPRQLPRMHSFIRFLKFFGAAWLAAIAVSMWIAPFKQGEEGLIWTIRVVFPILMIWLVWSGLRTIDATNLKENLRAITPFEDNLCYYCDGEIDRLGGEEWCSSCNLQRHGPPSR